MSGQPGAPLRHQPYQGLQTPYGGGSFPQSISYPPTQDPCGEEVGVHDGYVEPPSAWHPPQQAKPRKGYVHQHYYPTPVDSTAMGPGETSASRCMPIPRPSSTVYNTPPTGSLGTPQIGNAMWMRTPQGHQPRSGPTSHRGSQALGSPSSSSNPSLGTSTKSTGAHMSQEELDQITLLPTRPLLKALAKHCKPHAPWCVGCAPGTALPLAEELSLFAAFLAPTPSEQAVNDSARALVSEVCRSVWPDAGLFEMAATAAGQPLLNATTIHLYAHPSTDEGDETKTKLSQAFSRWAGYVETGADDRGLPCAMCTDSRSGKRFCIRYGEKAITAAASAQCLSECIATVPARQATLCALLALLDQNKILDDSGTHKGQLSGEAVAVMLLAVVNSYDSDDQPDSGRLLLDFFLTYGFQTNFDFVLSSVTTEGMRRPVPKRHKTAQLDVIDPGAEEVNLTPFVDRVSNLQAVFNYCYTALSQYQQISTNQRRAQSALSTIIGGEPYWKRVLLLYSEGIEPFYSKVQSKKSVLALNL